jgi:hypothetical protein
MRPLYEIATEYQVLLNDIINSEEVSEEQISELNNINGDMKLKATNIGSLIKNIETESEAIDNAIENMYQRSKRLKNKADKLREYLKFNMESCKLEKVSSPYFDINIRFNPPSIVIKNENIIPKEYWRENIVTSIDKLLIARELKSNKEIPGIVIERRTRLEIR